MSQLRGLYAGELRRRRLRIALDNHDLPESPVPLRLADRPVSQAIGAVLLTRALKSAGVDRLFTLSGNQIMPVFDACLDAGIELIHVRHEAAAVHMADAWGRLTGQPGVALVTAGPGHANALSALYVALADESPLVLLSGRSPRSQGGRGAFQDMAQPEMAQHVAKASWTATAAAALADDVDRALRLARSGRPGPVHVSLPVDVLESRVDEDSQPNSMAAADRREGDASLLDRASTEAILTALSEAAQPLVLAGPCLVHADGPALLAELAEAVHVPVVGMESPRGINDPSLGAFAEVLAQTDLILLLGKRLDFTLKQGEPPTVSATCRFIQVDPDASVLEQTGRVLNDPARLILTAVADPLPAVERLCELAAQWDRKPNDWFRDVQAAIHHRPREWQAVESSADGPLTAVEVCRAVREFLDETDDAVFISDGGEFGQWAQAVAGAPVRSAGRRLINGPSGAIGSSIPFAVAARLAFPTARIVALLGDGTFGFHGTEFDTAVRYNLPFVAVVGNDACWNAEYQIQLRKYGSDRTVGCELLPTRYDNVVQALGGHGEHVTRPSELRPALERAFQSNRPACVNVALQRVAAPVIRRPG